MNMDQECRLWQQTSALPIPAPDGLNASDVLVKHDVTLRGMWCGGFAWRSVSSIPAKQYITGKLKATTKRVKLLD